MLSRVPIRLLAENEHIASLDLSRIDTASYWQRLSLRTTQAKLLADKRLGPTLRLLAEAEREESTADAKRHSHRQPTAFSAQLGAVECLVLGGLLRRNTSLTMLDLTGNDALSDSAAIELVEAITGASPSPPTRRANVARHSWLARKSWAPS